MVNICIWLFFGVYIYTHMMLVMLLVYHSYIIHSYFSFISTHSWNGWTQCWGDTILNLDPGEWWQSSPHGLTLFSLIVKSHQTTLWCRVATWLVRVDTWSSDTSRSTLKSVICADKNRIIASEPRICTPQWLGNSSLASCSLWFSGAEGYSRPLTGSRNS